MAWLSVGTCNDDLCRKMVQHGVLKEGTKLLDAFMNTDRGDFVLDNDRSLAYHDRPYKNGSIHMSAPHMYVTVLEALDLKLGQSFLNVGSGSGYFSCLVSFIMNGSGLRHGIDISAEAVRHSKACALKWRQKIADRGIGIDDTHNWNDSMEFIHGNCFDIDVLNTVSSCKYDRIYVGAGCPEKRKEFFFSMLSDNGILVVPVNERNQMIRIKRYMGGIFSINVISSVHFAPLIDSNPLPHQCTLISQKAPSTANDEFSLQITPAEANNLTLYHSTTPKSSSLRGDRYVKLPPVLWAPTKSRHKQFPPEFRKAVFSILLCSRRGNSRPIASVPFYIWIHILSFANRDWFTRVKTTEELLTTELGVERQLRKLAEVKLKEAELATRKAERERDLYRMVMLRVRSTYTGVMDADEEAAEELDDSDSEEEVMEEEGEEVEGEEEEGEEVEELSEDGDNVQHGQNGHAETTHMARGSSETELYLFEDDEEESDEEENELIFRDSVEGDNADHEAVTSSVPVSIPVYDCSSNMAVESTVSDLVSSSFNSSTTHDGSTLYPSSDSRSSSVDIPIHAFVSPNEGQMSAIKRDKRAAGKQKRADIAGDLTNDRLRVDSVDSDDSSDYDNSSCVSFLSMESDSFSLERDPSKKMKSQNDLHTSSTLSTNDGSNHNISQEGAACSSNSHFGEGNGNGRGYFSTLGNTFGLG